MVVAECIPLAASGELASAVPGNSGGGATRADAVVLAGPCTGGTPARSPKVMANNLAALFGVSLLTALHWTMPSGFLPPNVDIVDGLQQHHPEDKLDPSQ